MVYSKRNIAREISDSARADSELPASLPPPHAAEIVPHPEGAAGGLENIPEELLSAPEALSDELDHAGLDTVLPDEDQADMPISPVDKVVPEKWRQL